MLDLTMMSNRKSSREIDSSEDKQSFLIDLEWFNDLNDRSFPQP